jgi:hypothetical protein
LRPDVQDGTLDVDGLCADLKAKSRSSENGFAIVQEDIDEIMKNYKPSTATDPAPMVYLLPRPLCSSTYAKSCSLVESSGAQTTVQISLKISISTTSFITQIVMEA